MFWGSKKLGTENRHQFLKSQDGEYWPIRPLSTVTVWVALDRRPLGGSGGESYIWMSRWKLG